MRSSDWLVDQRKPRHAADSSGATRRGGSPVKFKRLMALVMSIALTSASYPFAQVANSVVPSQTAIQATGLNISGTVVRSDRKTAVANPCLRLRNVDTNAIVARTVSDRNGAFSLSALAARNVRGRGRRLRRWRRSGGERRSEPGCVTHAHDRRRAPHRSQSRFLSSTAFLVLSAAAAAGITAWPSWPAGLPRLYRVQSNSARLIPRAVAWLACVRDRRRAKRSEF